MGTNRSRFASWLASLAAVSATFASAQALAFPPKLEVQSASPTGSMPKSVVVSPDGKRLYVTNAGVADHKNVSVFDAATMQLVRAIDVPGTVGESAIAPDGKTLYLSSAKRSAVLFVDIETGNVARDVKAAHPGGLLVSRDGKSLFAAGSDGVAQIDAKTGEVVRVVRTDRSPRGMAITKGGKLYVASASGKSIDVFEGHDLSKHHRLQEVCVGPRNLALAPDESKLYVSCPVANEVAVLDTKAETFPQRVKVGKFPSALDVAPDGRFVVTADYRGSSMTIIDTADWSARTLDIPSLDAASGIAIARGSVAPEKPIEVGHPGEPKAEPAKLEKKGAAPGKAKTVKAHPKPAPKADAKKAAPLRIFVTGGFDNHVYSVGVAGTGPKFEVDPETALSTLKHRKSHVKQPVE